jgi:2-polyprenyl-3-methyl-5-hydroxy-6-metoxy-1,4-benzoquinol methylase
VPDPVLFELQFDPQWDLDERFFLDVEHRYTKSHKLVREAAGDLTGKRILDIGCSRGMLLERFRRYEGVEFWAIELEPESREIAGARGIEAEAHQINVFVGRELLARLPFASESVDVVLAAEIIEHIVDTQGFVAEIARVLRPGGTVLFSTPNILWWKYRLDLLRGRYPDPLEYRLRFGEDFGHVRTFTPALLRELAEEAGLEVVRVAGKRLGPISSLTRTPAPVARALDRLATRLPGVSDDVLLVARKPAQA